MAANIHGRSSAFGFPATLNQGNKHPSDATLCGRAGNHTSDYNSITCIFCLNKFTKDSNEKET